MALKRLLLLALITVSVEAQTRPATDSIYQAIRNDDLAALAALGRGDVSLKDDQGQTPLMWASAFGSVAAVRVLLESGADPKLATATGLTALHLAATNAAKTRLLLEAGADLNAVSPLGRTPLLIAASATDSIDAARLLLDRGANINARDPAGLAPLAAAARVDNKELAWLLLARGADVKATANAGGPPADALMGAAASGNLELVRTLLAKGADVHGATGPNAATVKNGSVQFGNVSALHFAVTSGNAAVVRVLLEAGAAVNAKDVRGMTPLMFAIATDRPNLQIVRALLAAGADTTITSKADENAVAWAQKFQEPDVLAALKLSPSRAASVERDVAQRTPGQTARAAVERSLPLLQTGSRRTMTDGGCVACHAQPLTGLAAMLARSRGWTVAASDDLAQVQTDLKAAARSLMQLRDGGGLPDGLVYGTLLLAAAQVPANSGTDALVYYLAAKQQHAGNWVGVGASRAPIQDGDFSRTAMAIRALHVYGVPAQARETAARVKRAAKWLAAESPRSTEDRVMQLLGLLWANEETRARDGRMRELLALQRADGGWAQTQHLESDAYSTGQVVYTLRQLNVPARDPRLQRAGAFLLRTQQDDGSWHITNRAMKIQPYFESGFPYGHDQWISQAGTAWAAMALTVVDLEQPAAARAQR